MSIPRIPRGNPAGWALAAVVTIVAGFADLWRGGTSSAALLIVVGYLVFVPLALRSALPAAALTDPTRGGTDAAPPYRAAAMLTLAVLLLYVLTLSPTTAMWDTSEYIAVAKILGLPHPPGNPLFVLVAHVFALLPIPVSYAERVNLLAATTSALSAGLWFLVTHRALAGSRLAKTARVLAAAAGAIVGATAFTVWNQSVVNEKVYTLALFAVALIAWLALRWHDTPAGSRRSDLALLTAAYLGGLGYAIHPAGVLPLPAFGLFILLRRPATLLRWRLLATAGGLFLFGLTPFVYAPIRAAHNPAINEGHPTACLDGPKLSCMLTATTWERLAANIGREQYGGHAVIDRQAPIDAQIGMWWQYFEWQWWRDALDASPRAQRALAALFLGLVLLGGVVHWRQDRASFAFVAPLLLTLTPLLIFYLNFRYGYSQFPELGDSVEREVRERDYFYVFSFASLAIWIGVAFGWLWRALANAIMRATATVSKQRAFVLTAPVLLLALIPLIGNRGAASRAGDRFTREWAHDLLMSVEPYAVLVTIGDNDSFPLWYAQQVEGIRRDVSVVLTPYLGIDWYGRQQRRASVDRYIGDGLASYAPLAGARPTRPMFALTDAETDAIPHASLLREEQEFRHGAIRARIGPGVLTRDQFLVLRLIADSFPDRPVYFSLGGYPRSLGLGEHLVTQGLAQKLTARPARELPGVVQVPGGYVDVTRSRELWNRYRAPKALLDSAEWIDDASVNIPSAYAFTARLVAYASAISGDTASASRLVRQAGEIEKVLRIGDDEQ